MSYYDMPDDQTLSPSLRKLIDDSKEVRERMMRRIDDDSGQWKKEHLYELQKWITELTDLEIRLKIFEKGIT